MTREIHMLKGNQSGQIAGSLWFENDVPITLHNYESSFWNLVETDTATYTPFPSIANQSHGGFVCDSGITSGQARTDFDISSVVQGNFYSIQISVTAMTGVPIRDILRLVEAPMAGPMGVTAISAGVWALVFQAGASHTVCRVGMGTNGNEGAGVAFTVDYVAMFQVTGLTDPGPRISMPGSLTPYKNTQIDTVSGSGLITPVAGTPVSTIDSHNTILNVGNSFSHKSALDWTDQMLSSIPSSIMYINSRSGQTMGEIIALLPDIISRDGMDSNIVHALGVGILQEIVNSINDDLSLAQLQTQALTILNAMSAAGMKNIITTCAPYKGSAEFNPTREAIRVQYNAWTFTLGIPVNDIDTLLKDPGDAEQLNPIYDSGDNVHLNAAGYIVMGDGAFAAWEQIVFVNGPPTLTTLFIDQELTVGDAYGPVDATINFAGATSFIANSYPDGVDSSDPANINGTVLRAGNSYPGIDAFNDFGSVGNNHFTITVNPLEITVSETAIQPVANATVFQLKKEDGHNIMSSGFAHNFVGVRFYSDAGGTTEVPITGSAVVEIETVEAPLDPIAPEGATGQRFSFAGNPIGGNIVFTGGNVAHFFKVFSRQNRT